MQFTLRTFFLLFVVLWSSLAVFGVVGIAVFVDLVILAVILHAVRSPTVAKIVVGFAVFSLIGIGVAALSPLPGSVPRESGIVWARVAAIPVWLMSASVLLFRARQSWRSASPEQTAVRHEQPPCSANDAAEYHGQ
ncbi:MAG: hypothetical protein LLG00_00940 [Planctomycetaceae bacterium]|nr:hypothetical protein [Planctomycetaceae bacterium]